MIFMRVSSTVNNLLGSFTYAWKISDKPKIFYFQLKSLANRFVLKRNSANSIVSVVLDDGPLYFRDNWFDPRSLGNVFDNDYTDIEPAIFTNLKTFVDVGSNLGYVARCAKRASQNCKIYCFDALKENTDICKMNNPSAVVENCALGSTNGNIELLVDDCNFMASSIKFSYKQTPRKVNLITLDSYFDKINGQIDLLKIDVEGMEIEVLKGAANTLKKTKKLVAEVHSSLLLGDALLFLSTNGFDVQNKIEVEKDTFIVYAKRK